MNNYQNEIQKIFFSAKRSIKVAVSWFTDELLLEKLIDRANELTVQVLLSSDEVNVLRHIHLKRLIDAGAIVRKIGSNNAIESDFMHSKFVIIDDESAYGGSYNFTVNAQNNYENFKMYDASEVGSLIANFNSWINRGMEYFNDLTDPDTIVNRLKRKFIEEEERRNQLMKKLHDSNIGKEMPKIEDEKSIIIQSEVKKDELRKVTSSLSTGTVGISRSGKLAGDVKKRPTIKNHRYYGGNFMSSFRGQKVANSYAVAYFQKMSIERQYNFLKCIIIDDTLVCKGVVESSSKLKYVIRIEFRSGEIPRVYILNPSIIMSADIHIYQEGNLCLFYPSDLKWKDRTSIAEYTIPWTIEWIHLYELWLQTGKWEATEKKHTKLIQ